MQAPPALEEMDEEFDVADTFNGIIHDEAQRKLEKALPVPPPCLCHEPAQLLHVKKDGPNQGRAFYNCARPSNKGQCPFFCWASDYMANPSKYHPDDGMVKNVKEINHLKVILANMKKSVDSFENYIEHATIITKANREAGATVKTKTTQGVARKRRTAQ